MAEDASDGRVKRLRTVPFDDAMVDTIAEAMVLDGPARPRSEDDVERLLQPLLGALVRHAEGFVVVLDEAAADTEHATPRDEGGGARIEDGTNASVRHGHVVLFLRTE